MFLQKHVIPTGLLYYYTMYSSMSGKLAKSEMFFW